MPQSFDFKILAKLRKKKRLTIEKLAQIAGISYSAVADIERNKVTPNLETLNKIANVLDYRTSDIISLVEGRQAEIFKTGENMRCNGFEMRFFPLSNIRFVYGHAKEAHSSEEKHNTHPNNTELMFVIKGACRIVIEENEYIVHAGELMQFEGFQRHYYEALENDTSIILIHQSK
ncbi:MAG: helix-turn-helix domain-containing protein [Candidatus Auribacterota bacterium]